VSDSTNFQKPRWLRDLMRFLPLKSQFVLSGNISDLQAYAVSESVVTAVPLEATLNHALRSAGYANVIIYNPITGFRPLAAADGQVDVGEELLRRIGIEPAPSGAPVGLELLSSSLDRFVNLQGDPSAILIDFASRLVIRNDVLTTAEHHLFSRALVLSHSANPRPFGEKRTPFFNTIIWIVDKEGDLPDWFLVENPRVRRIPIAKPDHIARRAIAPALLRSLLGGREAFDESLASAVQALVDETEGLLLMDLKSIVLLGRSEGLSLEEISDAVRRYKVGVTDDPWRKIDHTKITKGDDFIRRRVKGQQHAVTHMLDIVKRSMTGIGSSPRGGRPRGVAFLAGPTGVGKTELAKTITSLLFGDESAYIRFDMSEFSAEHADQRLIGAPPGYVGYDVGGELTNAVRERPFSVVLFDEIEKAHPRILDKFLQVLDDGVLTSGRGERVYFSESFIIFTSNLGIYTAAATGERIANVSPNDSFDTVKQRVRGEIEIHFKRVLNRPELLNRIGENIIIFDFIRPDVAEEIFDHMVENLLKEVSQLGFVVTLEATAREALRQLCLSDLSNGGRGIRNQVEAHLINPLSRALFDSGATVGRYAIRSLTAGDTTVLSLSNQP